ncbi:uncharacterized protein BO95DRAFT_192150 [Aspergillus brunneoviolaceus CBS 621.78]|uniref:Uncharacterized protein n=1 Tax=Aspergillus brunneoviolaceus CBS 621.78 TaxID=1450534 RepID=A0ACD1G3S1_9EURO|nr:hypothetical protein BO95DRAFT_192150 [Aspergillus brunneoviolaceus CBS 621.78]RAH43919.1 hypothetical protein BO95DRAFT_192150 [Aspergillus brunneoviolaceus CBS 621.78]
MLRATMNDPLDSENEYVIYFNLTLFQENKSDQKRSRDPAECVLCSYQHGHVRVLRHLTFIHHKSFPSNIRLYLLEYDNACKEHSTDRQKALHGYSTADVTGEHCDVIPALRPPKKVCFCSSSQSQCLGEILLWKESAQQVLQRTDNYVFEGQKAKRNEPSPARSGNLTIWSRTRYQLRHRPIC